MRLLRYIKRKLGIVPDDGYDQARLNAAEVCLKAGKSVVGKMYPDGRVVVGKVVDNKREGSMSSLQGKVKWFDAKKGYGFVSSGGKDYFVHFSSIKSEGYRKLVDGEEVEFDLGKTDKGECAVNVVRLNPPAEKARAPKGNRKDEAEG